ncbi:hypothetical protein [Streptomyces sp. NPDC001492]
MPKKTREELLASLPDDPVNAERPIESLQQKADRLRAEPRASREERLAEELCHAYHYGVGLDELDEEDPDQARAHRRAAQRLLRWLEDAPKRELKAAFQRGYDRGKERQKERTAEDIARLEAEVAELRQDRDPEGLRARIADLQYVARGYGRIFTGGTDLRGQLADALGRLEEAQRELAELKGVQPSNATGKRPS